MFDLIEEVFPQVLQYSIASDVSLSSPGERWLSCWAGPSFLGRPLSATWSARIAKSQHEGLLQKLA
jgi:hypothetical protein